MNRDPNSAFYLYGFTRSDLGSNGPAFCSPPTAGASPSVLGALVLGAAGIDERHPPFFWSHGELVAILSLVARDEFCGPVGESNLQTLTWLGPRVCQHQAVLEQAMHCAPILPARFGTLFSSIEALARFMEHHQATIAGFLDRVAGQEEWAVKGLLDRARAEDALCQWTLVKDKAPLASSPGLAFLHEQRSRLKAKQELGDCLAAVGSALVEELTPLASETCQRQVLSRETTGADQEMVFNWAFLLPQGAVADLQKRVEEVNTTRTLPGLTFAVSGPWPSYSFCPALEMEPA